MPSGKFSLLRGLSACALVRGNSLAEVVVVMHRAQGQMGPEKRDQWFLEGILTGIQMRWDGIVKSMCEPLFELEILLS
jgi:hypothetical protein